MKYDVLCVDLPWKYNSRKAGGERRNKTKFGGGAEKYYNLMPDEEIFELSSLVDKVSAENCALFLWTVPPKLNIAFKVFEAWEFRYATKAFTWIKLTKDESLIYNPGYYTASNSEDVLLGVRGSMRPTECMIQQVVFAPRGKHSQKPEEVQDRIERMYPNATRLEMFATRQRDGWTCVGNAIDGKDIRVALGEL